MKKLLTLIMMLVPLAAQVKAQKIEITDDDIVYVDFVPDTVMTGYSIAGLLNETPYIPHFLHLDIDSDGTYDVEFFRYSSPPNCNTNPYYPKLMLWSQSLFCPCDINLSTFNNSVEKGDTLSLQDYQQNISYRFDFPEANSCNPIYPPDPWPTPVIGNGIWPRHYIGVRKHIDDIDKYCYGWMEVDVRYESARVITLTLYRMAYCKEPDYPYFRVGQTEAVWDNIEESRNNTFSIHPNPTTGKVSITLLDNNSSICQVEVRNLLGATVLETGNIQSNTLDVSALPAGVYIVRIVTNDGKQEFAKLVKR
jgi:hypothetical protein